MKDEGHKILLPVLLYKKAVQTFTSGPPKEGHPSPYFGEYPPDFFNFLVIDDCHRGRANDAADAEYLNILPSCTAWPNRYSQTP